MCSTLTAIYQIQFRLESIDVEVCLKALILTFTACCKVFSFYVPLAAVATIAIPFVLYIPVKENNTNKKEKNVWLLTLM